MDAKPHKQMREGLCGEKRSEWENRVPETCHPGVKSPGTGCGQAAPRRSRAKEKRGLAPQSAANPLPGSGEKEESEKLKSGYARIGVPNQFCLFFGVTCVFFWGVAGVFFWGGRLCLFCCPEATVSSESPFWPALGCRSGFAPCFGLSFLRVSGLGLLFLELRPGFNRF